MKKIVIDARESGTSTGRYIDKLVENLAQLGSDFDFTVLTKTPRVDYLKSLAPKFEILESEFKEFTFGEQLGLKKQIKALKPDLVHFGIVQQPVFYRGTIVTTMHDLTTVRFRNPTKNPVIYMIKQSIYKWVNKKVARKSLAVITPSEFVKNDVVDYTGANPDKITVTYEAADKITAAVEPIESLADKKFLMYIGRPMPHKNLEKLVMVFAELHKTRPDLCLALAGKKDANYERIETAVKARGINNVVFTDFISEGQLKWMYENCQLYVFPSLSEGFGLPGLEAMVHGAPVVSSSATCLPEIYGNAAHYFDPTSDKDMLAKISEVLDSPRLRQSLIAKGYEQIKKYSWAKMAEQTLEVYKKALAD